MMQHFYIYSIQLVYTGIYSLKNTLFILIRIRHRKSRIKGRGVFSSTLEGGSIYQCEYTCIRISLGVGECCGHIDGRSRIRTPIP